MAATPAGSQASASQDDKEIELALAGLRTEAVEGTALLADMKEGETKEQFRALMNSLENGIRMVEEHQRAAELEQRRLAEMNPRSRTVRSIRDLFARNARSLCAFFVALVVLGIFAVIKELL